MKSSVKIGRDKSNDIEINEPRISRNHAIINRLDDDTFEIKDLGSSNGTFVNGLRITKMIISPNDKVEVSTCLVDWVPAFSEQGIIEPSSNIEEEPYSTIFKTISVGSSKENDIIISENIVSKQHAKISLLKNGNYYIRDLSSSNGTFVNGSRILSKNFTKTDVVKIATMDLPPKWFGHARLRSHLLRDHKKAWFLSLSLLIVISVTALFYFNRCEWFNYGCNLSAQQIYLKNKNSIVHIVHGYFYTVNFQGKNYYVGKNRLFKVTEANTSKENLLPYNSVEGSGCFVKDDGTILTSVFMVNPWLDESERLAMIREVVASKTIRNFTPDQDYSVCGETSDLQWLADGLVNNAQNYIAASAAVSCQLTDSIYATIQSVKKELPQTAQIINSYCDSMRMEYPYTNSSFYFSASNILSPNSVLKDTFYLANDSFNISLAGFLHSNDQIPEGSIVLNERGELTGIIQQHQIVQIQHYRKQIKN